MSEGHDYPVKLSNMQRSNGLIELITGGFRNPSTVLYWPGPSSDITALWDFVSMSAQLRVIRL